MRVDRKLDLDYLLSNYENMDRVSKELFTPVAINLWNKLFKKSVSSIEFESDASLLDVNGYMDIPERTDYYCKLIENCIYNRKKLNTIFKHPNDPSLS